MEPSGEEARALRTCDCKVSADGSVDMADDLPMKAKRSKAKIEEFAVLLVDFRYASTFHR
jgi:hypothetical protein